MQANSDAAFVDLLKPRIHSVEQRKNKRQKALRRKPSRCPHFWLPVNFSKWKLNQR
jgi:hypothetical protein